MIKVAIQFPMKTGEKDVSRTPAPAGWSPFGSLHREIDRVFDDFNGSFWAAPFRRSIFDVEPLWQRETDLSAVPAVDITEKDKAYEITAELPGMDEKSIEVKLANGGLTIRGEKHEEKEEKKRTTISTSATLAPSNATSACRKVSIPIR